MSQYLTGLNLIDPGVKRYNGGTSSFTMDNNGTTNGTLLWVSGVAQVPGVDYTVSGATISTTTAAPAGTNTVVSLQLFETGIVNTVASGSIASGQLAAGLTPLGQHTIWVPASAMEAAATTAPWPSTEVKSHDKRHLRHRSAARSPHRSSCV